MKPWKAFILQQFAKRNIYISRKYHPNDGTITNRIARELAIQGGGILHIGGHEGQEAPLYEEYGIPVIWIEAIPEKFQVLLSNISAFSRQTGICALLGETNQQSVPFFVSDNNAASSSIFLPKQDAGVPFFMREQLVLDMKRLDSIISQEQAQHHRHWVIDVQGAEMNVLVGAGELLRFCNSMIIEAKRESNYIGGTGWDSLVQYLKSKGFIPLWQIGEHDEDNAYFIRVEKRVF